MIGLDAALPRRLRPAWRALTRRAWWVVGRARRRRIERDLGARAPGISALVRVKDEEEWIYPSLESLIPLVDEIVVTDASTDASWEQVRAFGERYGGQLPVKLVHIEAAGSSPFQEAWARPLATGPYVAQSNLGLTLCAHRVVIRWDADYIGSERLPELRERILDHARRTRGGWCAYHPVVNVSGDLEHVCRSLPLNRERRVHANWSGLRYRVSATGRWEELNIPRSFHHSELGGSFIFHMMTLKPRVRLLLRGSWTDWREASHARPRETPPTLEEFVLARAEREWGMAGASLDECAERYVSEQLLTNLTRYDPARYGPLPERCAPGRRYRVLYDESGRITGRAEDADVTAPPAAPRGSTSELVP